MKRVLYLLLSLLFLPLLGLFLSVMIHEDMWNLPPDPEQYHLCTMIHSKEQLHSLIPTFSFYYHGKIDGSFPEACRQVLQARQLKNYSLISAAIAVLFPMLYWLVAMFAKTNKNRMIFIFPKLIKTSLLALIVLTLGNGLIVALGADLVQIFYFNASYLWLTILLVVGAVTVAVNLSLVLWQLSHLENQLVVGKYLPESEYSSVYHMVKGVADSLGSQRPDHIVVGFDANFFITSQGVDVLFGEEVLEGATLYISLPLCRLLSKPEIVTIIGHELGHFRGGDTDYTLKFIPVYRGLEQSLAELYQFDGFLPLWSILPANMLFFMHDIFLEAEGRMSREREFEADKAAMEVGSPEALASSLLKLGLYTFLWEDTIEKNCLRLERGLYTKNLSLTFANVVRYDVAHDKALLTIDEMLENELSHPTDTHPSTAERIQAVSNGAMPVLDIGDLTLPEEPASLIFDDYLALEEVLTRLEHSLAVEHRGIENTEIQENDTAFQTKMLEAVYYVIAHLITIDEEIHDNEIGVAEHIVMHLIPSFDPVDFREVCYSQTDQEKVLQHAQFLAEVLSEDGRTEFIEMLFSIAGADAKYLEVEHSFIVLIQQIFVSDSIT